MRNKSRVSLEQKMCPVCGKEHTYNCGILIDHRLKDSMERYTTTGYGLCEEHAKLWKDDFVALIVVDLDKSGGGRKLEELYRTGEITHMKIESFKQVFGVEDSDVCPLVAISIPMAASLKKKMDKGDENECL
jgi:hypothetical protein